MSIKNLYVPRISRLKDELSFLRRHPARLYNKPEKPLIGRGQTGGRRGERRRSRLEVFGTGIFSSKGKGPGGRDVGPSFTFGWWTQKTV